MTVVMISSLACMPRTMTFSLTDGASIITVLLPDWFLAGCK